MSETAIADRTASEKVIRTLGELINHSHGLKYYLHLIEKAEKHGTKKERLAPTYKFSDGTWFQIARWWKRYRDAWAAIEEIIPTLSSRWESRSLALKWVDELRGSLNHLSIPFRPRSYLRTEEIMSLEGAFGQIVDADKKMALLNNEWAAEYSAAVVRTTVTGIPTGTAYDETWIAAEKRIGLEREAIAAKILEAGKQLESHRYGAQFSGIITNSDWQVEINFRIAEIESRTAMLMSLPAIPKTAPNESPQPPSQTSHSATLDKHNFLAIVNGKPKPLKRNRFKIVEALMKAGPTGLTLHSLSKLGGDARGVLTRMRDSDADWAAVIHMAETTGGRYSIS